MRNGVIGLLTVTKGVRCIGIGRLRWYSGALFAAPFNRSSIGALPEHAAAWRVVSRMARKRKPGRARRVARRLARKVRNNVRNKIDKRKAKRAAKKAARRYWPLGVA